MNLGKPIDKMAVTTHQNIRLDCLNSKKGVQKKYIAPHGYRYAFAYYIPGAGSIAIRCNPYYSYITSSKLEFNPADFSDYASCIQFITDTFEGFDITEPRIQRIDLKADVAVNFSFFYHHLHVLNKRKTTYISSDSHTLIIGQKPAELHVYDKAKQAKMVKDSILTRLEARYYNYACPIRQMHETEKLMSFEPFKNIRLYKINENANEVITCGLKRLVETYGMCEATLKKIKYEKIKTYIKKGYISVLNEPDIAKTYRENLELYMGASSMKL